MPKLILSTISTLRNDSSAVNTLNNNFQAISDAIENTVSRDGTSPNILTASLDANANRIVNLPAPTSNTEPVRLIDLPTDSLVLASAIASAAASATASGVSAAASSASASSASGSATTASTQAGNAATSATNANNSAIAAAASAAGVGNSLLATSVTSLSIATGSKVFTTQSGKSFQTGEYIIAVSAANPTVNYMFGDVTSYSGTTLTLNSTIIGGSGTKTDWIISISGLQGPKGDTGSTGASGGGSGNVVAPASATVNNVALFNNISGTLLKDGGATGATGLSLLAAASATAARTTIGAVIGTDVQAFSSKLTFLDTASTNTAAAYRTLLGLVIGTDVQAFDSELLSIAGLTSAADKVPYFTGSGTASTADFTAFGRLLVANADAAAGRSDLGLGTAAVLNVGTSANQIVQLDAGAKLPAIDGSQLTNLASAGVPTTRQVIAGNGLNGGGALSADITLTLGTPLTLTGSTTNSVGAGSHSHALTLVAADVIPAAGGSVGSYLYGVYAAGGSVIFGASTSGANIVLTSGHGNGASFGSGTWRNHGNVVFSGDNTLWLRIS